MAEAKTIAVVGFSSSQARAGYYVPAYLQEKGYRIIPVNPNLTEGLGEPAVAASWPRLPNQSTWCCSSSAAKMCHHL